MRSFFRAVAASILALYVLGAASTAVLAATPAETGRYSIDDEWCFQDVVLRYCFDFDGFVSYVALPDGRERVTIQARETTVVTRDGAVVGETREVSIDKTLFVDGGLSDMHTVTHAQASFDDQTCTYTAVLKIGDYEVVLDQWNGPGCN
jgi:hypothetical protein